MRPPSVFAASVSRPVDPSARRAAALARVRLVPHRPSRAEVRAEAFRIAADESLPFSEAISRARLRAKKGTT